MKEKKEIKKLRGDHCLNVFVSYELKEQIKTLAKRYDRTTSGIPGTKTGAGSAR